MLEIGQFRVWEIEYNNAVFMNSCHVFMPKNACIHDRGRAPPFILASDVFPLTWTSISGSNFIYPCVHSRPHHPTKTLRGRCMNKIVSPSVQHLPDPPWSPFSVPIPPRRAKEADWVLARITRASTRRGAERYCSLNAVLK